jgi:hypothetical protein
MFKVLNIFQMSLLLLNLRGFATNSEGSIIKSSDEIQKTEIKTTPSEELVGFKTKTLKAKTKKRKLTSQDIFSHIENPKSQAQLFKYYTIRVGEIPRPITHHKPVSQAKGQP